jgi:hypothetical protein
VKEEVLKVKQIVGDTPSKLEVAKLETKFAETMEEIKKTRPIKEENENETRGKTVLRREDVLEEIEIEKRRLNVVIMGLTKEEGDGEQDVKDLFERLSGAQGVKAIVNVARIGRQTTGKVRPLRVTLANPDSRGDILRRCVGLRNTEEYKVFIAPDLTRKQ